MPSDGPHHVRLLYGPHLICCALAVPTVAAIRSPVFMLFELFVHKQKDKRRYDDKGASGAGKTAHVTISSRHLRCSADRPARARVRQNCFLFVFLTSRKACYVMDVVLQSMLCPQSNFQTQPPTLCLPKACYGCCFPPTRVPWGCARGHNACVPRHSGGRGCALALKKVFK